MSTITFDSPIKRIVNDGIPIIFDWVRSGVELVITVAFDNTTFVPVVGSVEELSPGKYRLNYHESDRPSSPSLISYRVAEGGDVGIFEVLILQPQAIEAPSTPSEFTAFGPKRVRTRDLDIEQHDPEKLDRLSQKQGSTIPTFCDSHFCKGVPK